MGSLPPRKRHKEKAGRIDRRVSLRSVHAHESVLAEQTVMLDRSSEHPLPYASGFKMMFFSGFLRKKLFRFSPGMTIILARKRFLQEGYLPVPDRCQSATFPSNHMVLAPPLPFFLLFLICVTLLLDKSLHFLLLFSSKTGRISSGTALKRIKIKGLICRLVI